MDMHTLHVLKWIINKDSTVEHRELCLTSSSLDGRECGREWTHVYIWLSPSNVYLKLPQTWLISYNSTQKAKKKKRVCLHLQGMCLILPREPTPPTCHKLERGLRTAMKTRYSQK